MPTRWHDIDGSRIADLPRASFDMLLAVLRLRLRYSLFSYIIPLFDHLWPTTTLRVRHGLSVLVVGLHDPRSPHAGESERYLHEVGASLVRHGHQVHWLAAGFGNASTDDEIDGITVRRVGNRLSARAAIPLSYVRHLRNRFDVIVEVQHGMPLLSPLFSLKPKVCLTARPAQFAPLNRSPRWLEFCAELIGRQVVRALYRSSRFIAISSEHESYLNRIGIESERIEKTLEQALDASEEPVTYDRVARTFLDAVYAEVSRSHSSYVLSGKEWAIVPHRRRFTILAPAKNGRRAETLL
jgi:hypothetical protein